MKLQTSLYLFFFSGLVFSVGNINGQDLLIAGGAPVNEQRSLAVSCIPQFSYDTPETWETGLTGDGDFVWSGGTYGDYYYKADGATGTFVDSILIPYINGTWHGGDLAFDGQYLWTTVEQDGMLFKIDPVSKTVVNQFTLPVYTANLSDPNHWGVACHDGNVWYTEYAYPNNNAYNSLLFHLNANGTVLDSFVIDHRVLPLEFIDGELWGAAFDVPWIYKYDQSTGAVLDSVPRCVNSCYGLTKNNQGFWLNGVSALTPDPIIRMDGLTGLNEFQAKSINVFPVPASELLTIQAGGSKQTEIFFYTVTGARIFIDLIPVNENTFTVDISHLPSGIYIAEFRSLQNVARRKIIKN